MIAVCHYQIKKMLILVHLYVYFLLSYEMRNMAQILLSSQEDSFELLFISPKVQTDTHYNDLLD